ncbi:MAG: hypothetical protein AAFU85_11780 [Planctomycetota bacterium]
MPRRSTTVAHGTLKNTRREALTWLTMASVAGMTGCSGTDQATDERPTRSPRIDVPLRIVLVGTELEAETLRRAWSMTMEQPLKIDVLSPLRLGSGETETIADHIADADAAILPQYAIGQVDRDEAIVRFTDATLQDYDEQFGAVPPAVKNGLGNYGGETLGIPLGAKLFSVLSIDSEPACATWAEYHDWVKDLGGRVAEPTSEGWAASSFLNRCATTVRRGWLFDRKSLKPELTEEDYVAVLAQFADTAKVSKSADLDPPAIWSAVRGGELRGGIGFEVTPIENPTAEETDNAETFELTVSDCPLECEIERLYFDFAAPLAAVSQGCRQTDAAKQFLGWLAGGETAAGIRNAMSLGSNTRQAPGADSSQPSPYMKWLSQRLEARRVVPPLALPNAHRYYRALDKRVRQCLAGERDPADALRAAHDDWESITEELGREQQAVAWRKGLGFGA